MAKMIDLDDLEAISRLDSEGVLDAVERFADQCREGWLIGTQAADLPDGAGVDGLAILGMGGSGVSGDVVQAVAGPRLPVAIRTIKSYGPLPEWIGRNTLLFAVSYSGNTEETIAALDEGLARGARAVVISSGGTLADIAGQRGLAHIEIPPGLQPRASLGYLTMPIFAALTGMGLLPDMQEEVDETVAVVAGLADRCHRKMSMLENPAKDLATHIFGNIPVVYGSYGLGSVAAYRFKCDLNEYGKTPAFWNELPELDHNEIVGWNQLADLTGARFVLVMLRDPEEHERVALRFEITRRLIEEQVAQAIEVTAEEGSALARLMSLVYVTQLAAIYVGIAYGVDPGPVDVIEMLKGELAER